MAFFDGAQGVKLHSWRRIYFLQTIRQFALKLKGTEAQEILEAAIVLPLAFMLLLGIVEFGRVFNINSTIQQAAQQGALAAARNTCASCGNNGNVGTMGGCPVTGTAGSATYAIASVLCASNLDPTQIQQPPSAPNCAAGQPCSTNTCPVPYPQPASACSATGKVYVCQNVQLNPPATTQPPQCGTVVSFQYPFKFILPFTSINASTITLTAQAQSRMEN
jgi:hypothetical protein